MSECPRLTEDVLVPDEHGLVDLGLSEPARFFSSEEDFDGHLLPPPAAQPHVAVAALPDLTNHLDLLGDRPLHLEQKFTPITLILLIYLITRN